MTVKITELGYMGIGVSDAEAWKKYAQEQVGLEIVDEGEGDRFYMRMDYWHHRFVVHTSGEDDLLYLGWRVADRISLEGMAKQLDDAGHKYRVATPEECKERRVLGLLKLVDPGGNPTEVFYGPQVDTDRPYHPGRPLHGGWITGDDGMGHVILRQPDTEAAFRFYTSVFGFKGSVEYEIPTPVGTVTPTFLHCGPRQHCLAFGLGDMDKRINHLMIEYAHLDDVGRSYDLCRKNGVPLAMELGKHSNDQALSYYMANPSGWLFELGWGARKALAQQEYYVTDIFGHAINAAGMGLDIDINRD